MKMLIAFAVAAVATPIFAQPPAPVAFAPAASSAEAAPAPVDSARLAVARQTVDFVWPLGTYQRMMSGPMMDDLAQSILNMKMSDIIPTGAVGAKGIDPKDTDVTLNDMVAKGDPYFRERIRAATRVLATELVPVFATVEPTLRDGLAQAYARRFTVYQLDEMNRFFATPVGRAYASQSMLIIMDPDVIRNMIKAAPALMQAMPQISAKIDAVEKQLPPPPSKAHPATPLAHPH